MQDDPASQDSQRSEALLSWIQLYSPYGVITLDKSLNVRSWNHWMEIHSGKSFKEVGGKNLLSLYPDLVQRRLTASLERALEGEASVLSTALHRYMLPMASPLGESSGLQMRQTARIAPLVVNKEVHGVVIVIEDVTQRENQAEMLTRQHQRDEMLSWALSHFLRSEEPRKTIRQLFFKIAEYLDFNSFALYLHDSETGQTNLEVTGGLSPEDEAMLGKSSLLISTLDFPEITVLEKIKSNTAEQYEPLRKADVSAAVAVPLVVNTRKLGILCFFSWIRESLSREEGELLTTIGQYLAIALDREQTAFQLKKAQHALQIHADLLEKKVEERTARLKETIVERETFSYTLAHDLKAPVRGMLQYCGALMEDFGDSMPQEARFLLERLARTPKKMEALIHDLLEFSKVSRQDMRLTSTEVGPILEDILALRVIEVRQAVTIREPLYRVVAHRALLQQVLANLIDNAIKFVDPKNQPEIVISAKVLDRHSPSTRNTSLLFNADDTSSLWNPGNLLLDAKIVRIEVADKGIGIPRELHQKIFGIFERGLDSGVYEGTGMGLAIVARAMQRMNGSCGVESEPNQGSCFWIELPAA